MELGKVRHAADAVFPFTSRNTFCVFAGAGLLVSATMLVGAKREGRLVWRCCGIVAASGVVSSHSRAGLVATGLGLVVMVVVATPSGKVRVLGLLASLGLAAALAAAGAVTLTGDRFAGFSDDLGIRLAIWRASAEIASQHLWLGLGSLDQALQMSPGDWGDRHILRAHNIYVQAVAERGMPAAMAMMGAILLAVRQISRSLASLGDWQDRAVPAAVLGVLALFAVHGLVDFSLYAPVNAAILAVLLGTGCGLRSPALPKPAPFATNAQLSPY